MRGCRIDSALFTVRVGGEIFLALNGSSFTVQMSTGKTTYDLELISYGFTHHFCLERTYAIFLCL